MTTKNEKDHSAGLIHQVASPKADTDPRLTTERGIPVFEHLPSGKTKKRWLRRDHVCTTGRGGCLRLNGSFAYCARFSYAG